jgi:circadian clock protein KaiC
MNDDTASSSGKPPDHDLMAEGGFGAHRTILVLGRRDSGKTLFAIQSLLSGVRRGEPGVFVTFERSLDKLFQQSAFFGWDIPSLQKQNLLRVAAHSSQDVVYDGRVEVDRFLDELRMQGTHIKAKNIVFDSFQVLFTLLKDRAQEVEETFRLREWLFENELSGIFTVDVEEDPGANVPRFAFMQFMADCVVALDFQQAGDQVQRAFRLVKYRGEMTSGPAVPFQITKAGLELSLAPEPGTASPANAGAGTHLIARARQLLSSHLAGLDGYLDVKQAELDYLMAKSKPELAAGNEPASDPLLDPFKRG